MQRWHFHEINLKQRNTEMEYGKYQIVKIDNDGEQVINTYKGLGAMEDALEEFMSWCADHEEDDQWVAKKYRNMLEGYDGEGM